MADRNCWLCLNPIVPGQLYTRAYIRNSPDQDVTDQPERFVSIHVDCPADRPLLAAAEGEEHGEQRDPGAACEHDGDDR